MYHSVSSSQILPQTVQELNPGLAGDLPGECPQNVGSEFKKWLNGSKNRPPGSVSFILLHF